MPQSITIAAFVLGAVLLLIGLLGGGFKIFGAEVSGNAGQGPRVAAGGLGVLFIAIGLAGSIISSMNGPAEQRVTPPTTVPTSGTGGNSEVSPQPPPPEPARPTRDEVADIAGEWLDEIGSRYRIRQTGRRFEFDGYNQKNGISTRGVGEITGRHVTNDFKIDTPGGPVNGTGTGEISDDGRTMYGTFSDPYYGRYGHTLTRMR